MTSFRCGSRLFVLATIAFFITAPARGDFTGSWTGTFTAVSVACEPPIRHGGVMGLTLTQNGASLSGSLTVEFWVSDCEPAQPQTFTMSVTGTATGNSLAATFPAGGGRSGYVTGVLSGAELVLAFAAEDAAGHGRLTRTGTANANIAGDWNGAYLAPSTSCPQSRETPGSVRLALSQNGGNLTGTIAVEIADIDCNSSRVLTVSGPVQGTVTGSSFHATFQPAGLPVGTLTGSVSGGVLVLSFVSGETLGTAELALQGAPGVESIAGTWSGNYTSTGLCRHDARTTSAAARAAFTSDTRAYGGMIGISNYEMLNGDTCLPEATIPFLPLPLGGVISGPSLHGVLDIPAVADFHGTVANGTLAFTISVGYGYAVSAILSHADNAQPDTRLTGFYAGTYSATEQVSGCTNLASYSYGGALEGKFVQFGTMTFGGPDLFQARGLSRAPSGTCTPVAVDGTLLMLSGIDGSSMTGPALLTKSDATEQIMMTNTALSGSSFAGTAANAATFLNLSASRTGPPSPLMIAFRADSDTLFPGQSTTLRWTTLAADSATIDQGIGPMTTSGWAVVSPTVTTTYTLTATGTGGTATVTTRVDVVPPPRRRAVRAY